MTGTGCEHSAQHCNTRLSSNFIRFVSLNIRPNKVIPTGFSGLPLSWKLQVANSSTTSSHILFITSMTSCALLPDSGVRLPLEGPRSVAIHCIGVDVSHRTSTSGAFIIGPSQHQVGFISHAPLPMQPQTASFRCFRQVNFFSEQSTLNEDMLSRHHRNLEWSDSECLDARFGLGQ